MPVAIVGIGCRFPGGIDSPHSFWQFLKRGGDGTREVPRTRWDIDEYYDPDPDKPGRIYTRRGGFIDNIDSFDPQFFGISPREAAFMDPQQRLLLETTWEAFEDAGIAPGKWAGREVGVYIGLFTHDYENMHMQGSERIGLGPHSATGNSTTIAANRLSHAFDFKGPSMVIDTACSSSLVAVHLACRALESGEARLAVAGGVNLQLVPEMTMSLCQASMLSPDGRCKSFDARANGYARADGVGMVVLKPLAEALADGDTVYGVVLGSAVNQDGRSNGITVPDGAAQRSVLRAALRAAGVAPSRVSYVEAHGTGTPVGDPIEARALGEVLGEGRAAAAPCLLGSVKSNFGHTESAAGIAGLIKLALMLKHGQIPPNLHFETPNPDIAFDALRLRVPTALEPWPDNGAGPRLAGLNSFGFGGTNAHAVIGEAPPREQAGRDVSDRHGKRPALLCLSARSEAALRDGARVHAALLKGEDGRDFTLHEIAGALAFGREHHPLRMSVVAETGAAAVERLEAFAAGRRRNGLVSATARGAGRKLGFVFSGMGQQWWAMGRGLLANEPVFAARIGEIDALFGALTSEWSLLSVLGAAESESMIDRTELAQPAIFALQVALADLWRSVGVVPDIVAGHSIGEVAAAHVAGVLSLEDAVLVCFHRSRLQARLAGRGGMLAVGLGEAEAHRRIAGLEDLVSLAAINSAKGVTLAGDTAALEELAAIFEGEGIFARMLNVEVPYHSPAMDEILAPLAGALGAISPKDCAIPLVSTVTGELIEGRDIGPAYWNRNARETVLFARAMDALIGQDCGFFVEIGAHPVLASSMRECLAAAGAEGVAIASQRRGEPDETAFLDAVGGLHCNGYELDFTRLAARPARHVPLPAYAWQHAPFWHESEHSRQRRTGLTKSGKVQHPLLGMALHLPHPAWASSVTARKPAFVADHRVRGSVVFPGAGYCELALAAAAELGLGADGLVLEKFSIEAPLVFGGKTEARLQLSMDAESRFVVHASSSHAGGEAEDGQHWRRHASGRIAAPEPQGPARRLDLAQLRGRLESEHGAGACYARLDAIGLEYGPLFRNLDQVWRGEGEALGKIVAVPEIAASLADYRFHPALLDACFQLLAALPVEGTFLPVAIDRLEMRARPGPVCWAHVRLVSASAQRIVADIDIADGEGAVIASVGGLACRRFEDPASERRAGDAYLYDRLWVAAPAAGATVLARDAAFLPAPSALAADLKARHGRRMAAPGRQRFFARALPALDELATAYFVKALEDLGWNRQAQGAATVRELAMRLGISQKHFNILERILKIISEDGLAERRGELWALRDVGERGDADAMWRRLVAVHPECHAELSLIQRCGSRLAALLRDEEDPLAVLFPVGSATAEHFYADAPTMWPGLGVLADAVTEIVEGLPEGEVLRVLEVGAGTGALAARLLPLLPAARCDYVFTDISLAFVNQARERFKAFPFVRAQVVDLEKDLTEQDIAPGSFDLIVAGDALHAASDLSAVLGRLRGALAAEGMLAFLELTAPPRWFDLVFGLLAGWWLFADRDVRPDHATLPAAGWLKLLRQHGFDDCIAIGDGGEVESGAHTVLLARAAQGEPALAGAPVMSVMPAVSGRAAGQVPLLLLADEAGIAEALAEELRVLGREVAVIGASEAEGDLAGKGIGARLDHVFGRNSAQVVDLRALAIGGAPAGEGNPALAAKEACIRLTRLVQALSARSGHGEPALWVVTNGTQSVGGIGEISLAQAPLWGLTRSAIAEHFELNCHLADLGPSPDGDEIAQLARDIVAGGPEDEIALRGERRFVSRIAPRENRRRADGNGPAFSLSRKRARPPADLVFEEAGERAPNPGEVLVRMHASGLNFKDFAIVAGLLDTSAAVDTSIIGIEGAGVVTAVGEGVAGLAPGDEVMGMINNALSNPGSSNEDCLVRKPANLTFEEAAGIPITFLSALHALGLQGGVRPGDKVLIHTAASGLGLAAIEVARHFGAEVYATAGNEEKRSYLRALGIAYVGDSRSGAFAGEIMALTDGTGVDVIVNTLPAAMMEKNISILRPGTGRVVDLANIHYGGRLEYKAMVRGVSVSAFDLTVLARINPGYLRTLLAQVAALFEAGALRPVPYRAVPVARAGETIHGMRRAGHIGKNVVLFAGERVNMTPAGGDIAIREDGSYLVSGGLGGFGLATAKWLARQGARHLVLAGRRGGAAPEAAAARGELEANGAVVEILACDVSNQSQVNELMSKFGKEFPPLRGVVHAAAVLRDVPIAQMTGGDFGEAMAAKAVGAWNLHAASLGQPLDFFICTSSVTNLVGNYAQANYGAANEFLEALVRQRRALGLPGLAVGLGIIAGTGIVARDKEMGELLRQQGMGELDEQRSFAAIAHGQRTGAAYVAAALVDWSVAKDFFLPVARSPRFSLIDLEGERGGKGEGSEENRKALANAATPQERLARLGEIVIGEVAGVLGMDPENLDIDQPLPSLGFDSLMAVELMVALENATGFNMTRMTLLRSDLTTANLIEEISAGGLGGAGDAGEGGGLGESGARNGAPMPAGPEDRAGEGEIRVEDLSDSEVEALLRQMAQEEHGNV